MKKNENDIITLAHGAGGAEMDRLIATFDFSFRGLWKSCDGDSSYLDIGNNQYLAFTTDSFVVDPIFFPGGNIGDLAFSGTINDLAVIGADPLGISLSLVIEEGFKKKYLEIIMSTIRKLSEKYKIPIVTGDTKVMEKNKVDKIIINTSGIGILKKDQILDKEIKKGDSVILSGGLGEHAVALLSKRYDFKTKIKSDTKPLLEELREIRSIIKIAKDPTRGGLSSALNNIAEKKGVGITIFEKTIPVKQEVKSIVGILGINLYELASEGRIVCISSPENSKIVLEKLKRFNRYATIIGEISSEKKVVIQTELGKSILHKPEGRIIPRIC